MTDVSRARISVAVTVVLTVLFVYDQLISENIILVVVLPLQICPVRLSEPAGIATL